MTSLDRWTADGALATAVGTTAALAPGRLARVYGLPPAAVEGGAALAWRLFGVRTAVIGAAVLGGSPAARSAVVPVQLLDQAVFAHALLRGTVPRRSGLLAVATSAALVALARR